jgi:hypothetical protein
MYYTLAGVYIAAGEAVFTTTIEQLNGRPVSYHRRRPIKFFVDNFFKARQV